MEPIFLSETVDIVHLLNSSLKEATLLVIVYNRSCYKYSSLGSNPPNFLLEYIPVVLKDISYYAHV